ncbi:MAG: hypothetical protein JKY95_09705 [Planctomycetaceae bacterium]|nr:hypothetical protein [Planctomycetaceae bacterium]
MCRDLSQTHEAVNERRIEYDLSWSTGLPADFDQKWKPLTFDGHACELSNAAATELERIEEKPEEPTLIKGRVLGLESEIPPGLDELQEHEHVITMLWNRENGRTIKIKIPLPPGQYKDACDAHKNGQEVKVYGTPVKPSNHWLLTKSQSFDVI